MNKTDMTNFRMSIIEKTIETYATEQLIKYNLWAKGWRFTWCNAVGSIGYADEKNKEIQYSKRYLDAPWDEITETIRHEIAHALTQYKKGIKPHGEEWKINARRVGVSTRAHSKVIQRVEGKWVLTCKNCNKAVSDRMHRRSKKNLTHFHPACGKEVGKLEWKEYVSN